VKDKPTANTGRFPCVSKKKKKPPFMVTDKKVAKNLVNLSYSAC
jgi:hypothetical protein